MLVGQAPGRMEAAGAQPFTGRGGRTLFKWFERAGIDEITARQKIYISALTRCYPGPHPSGRGDRVPSPRELRACADWLEQELQIIRPKLLLPVGKLAIAQFLPDQPLDELIGRTHEIAYANGKCLVVPLPHPSGASSWIHQGDHPELLNRAIELLGHELRRAGVIKSEHA